MTPLKRRDASHQRKGRDAVPTIVENVDHRPDRQGFHPLRLSGEIPEPDRAVDFIPGRAGIREADSSRSTSPTPTGNRHDA